MLVLAADMAARAGVSLCAASVDHGLRPEAAGEAAAVAALCERLGVEHATLCWERTKSGTVSQDAARRARHRLLGDWARQRGAGVVALGHTRDDRLETFLMRVRQGSGWHGLAGLLPRPRGPKSAHKLTPEVMSLIHDLHREGAPIQARALAQVVQQRLGVMVHPRSIERALARKKKR